MAEKITGKMWRNGHGAVVWREIREPEITSTEFLLIDLYYIIYSFYFLFFP